MPYFPQNVKIGEPENLLSFQQLRYCPQDTTGFFDITYDPMPSEITGAQTCTQDTTGFFDVSNNPNSTNALLLEILADGEPNGSTNIIDTSPLNKSILVQGNTQISTAVFNTGTGSVAFDGSNSSLQVQDSQIGTADFSLSFALYVNAYPGSGEKEYVFTNASNPIFASQSQAFSIHMSSNGRLGFARNSTAFNPPIFESINPIPLMTWTNVRIYRQTGGGKDNRDIWMEINSVDQGFHRESSSGPQNLVATTFFRFGSPTATPSATDVLNGYLDDITWNGQIGIPGSQPILVTRLLGNGSNLSTTIIDSSETPVGTITNVGNNVVNSTDQTFEGTGSLKFNDTNARFEIQDPSLILGTQSFQISFQYYPITTLPTADNKTFFDTRPLFGADPNGLIVVWKSNGDIQLFAGTSLIQAPGNLVANQWNQIVLIRFKNGSNDFWSLKVNGNKLGELTNEASRNFTYDTMSIGNGRDTGAGSFPSRFIDGYIDKFEIRRRLY